MRRLIAVADIGGTHARFALAEIERANVLSVGEPVTFGTSQHPSFADAWKAFLGIRGSKPDCLAVAFAGPVAGSHARLTNNDWLIDHDTLRALGIERGLILNDFGAIAHAVATLDDRHFEPLCGPSGAIPANGVTTILGPGTGLGVAMLTGRADGGIVIETEGGHVNFAPADDVEDEILKRLRGRFGRVSTEHVASGPGLAHVHWALSGGDPAHELDDAELWTQALAGGHAPAAAALDRWCAILGGYAGDLALAHGAGAVVIAGGLGYRLRTILPASPFAARFVAKPPFERRMQAIPVRLLAYPHAGLLGAAVAFARSATD